MSFLRSLLISTPLIALSTIVMGSLSILVSFFDPQGNRMHHLARIWGKMLLAVSFIHVRSEGLEKLDPRGTYVFVSNHASLMDIPAILSQLPHQFRFFAKKGLYKIPFLGGHLLRAGHLPVDRSSPRASLKSMTEAARVIQSRGTCMLLFPEGGRAPEGLREFKEGAAYIAIKAGVPIVPMALIGMREKLPMESIHIRGGSVILRIGNPISTKDLKVSDRDGLTQRLHQEIAGMLN
ncbi:MAG TPA: lysophospholipid acyltransferase family protein [Candidatus Sulfopaludibacter sp.]|nr:lysophospholipid acyltransferase family protein [Candidatus Sulfopaludibacter sp.]